MPEKIILGNGVEITIAERTASPTVVTVMSDEGITKTSANPMRVVASAVKSSAEALTSGQLGELIGRLSLEIADGVQSEVQQRAWECEYEICFGLIIEGGADVKIASCSVEGSFTVTVRFNQIR